MWHQPELFPQWSPVCVCVRAIIPMGESANTSNSDSQDLLLYTDTCGFKCAWMFMMIYDESLRIWTCFGLTSFFSWFCGIVFEYVFFLKKHKINLTFGLSLMGYELPCSCPPFFKIHMLRCLESSVAPHQPSLVRCNSLTGTCLSSSRNWWPRHWDFWWFLVFRLRDGTERKRKELYMSHKTI